MNYIESAKTIIKNVGGKGNIENVVHCVTRLRFTLKDDSIVNEGNIKKVKEVKGVMNSGGQYQIIIGSEVKELFDEVISQLGGIEKNKGTNSKKKMSIFDYIASLAAGIFAPLLYTMSAAGIIKAFLAIVTSFGWLSATSTEYQILTFISDAYFYFIPVFIAYTAGKKFGVNPYTSVLLAVIMLSPGWVGLVESGEAISFFGIPLRAVTYSTSVIPVILVVFLQSLIEPRIEKIVPKVLRPLICPAFITVTCSIAGFAVLGPIGAYVGDFLSGGINYLNLHVPIMIPIIYAFVAPLLVTMGIHTIFIPILIMGMTTLGYDASIIPAGMASNLAISGVTFAIALKSKHAQTKAIGVGGTIQAALGVTEPSIYGLLLPLKKPLYAAMAAGLLGGTFAGVMNVRAYAMVGVGINGIPSFIAPDGSSSNMIFGILTMIIGFLAGFLIQWKLGFDEEVLGFNDDSDEEPTDATISSRLKEDIYSPVTGRVIPLKEVNDKTFSDEIIGKGIAIIPEDDMYYSPIDGVITVLFPTKHAIGIKSDSGLELLIHIGIDTVKLEGEGFETFVKEGEKICKGDKLVKVDRDLISSKGFDLVTPIIVTNTNDYFDFSPTKSEEVIAGEHILTIA